MDNEKNLPDGELNPGLPRDRRGYSPLYYRGFDISCFNFRQHIMQEEKLSCLVIV